MQLNSLEVVGLKVFAECSGFAMQTDGSPYHNRFAWFLKFSEKTGKIVEIHEDMDTGLAREAIGKSKK